MRNAEIALHFDELADLYELDGAIVHRVLAYRNAAKSIRDSTASVEELTKERRVTELPGIGKTIAEKLATLFETGEIPAATKLKAKYPPGLVEITRLPGFGPKRARRVFDELGIASLDALRPLAITGYAAPSFPLQQGPLDTIQVGFTTNALRKVLRLMCSRSMACSIGDGCGTSFNLSKNEMCR